MKLSTREDIEAPITKVYSAASNFTAFERHMRHRGVMIVADETAPLSGNGRRWSAQFTWRGRERDVEAELLSIEDERGYTIKSVSEGVVCHTAVDLVALSRTRTRMLVSLDLRPTTLSSRLLIQSLKLAKGRLTGRLKSRLGEFSRRVEKAAN